MPGTSQIMSFCSFLPFFSITEKFYGKTIRVTGKQMIPACSAGKTTSEKLCLMFKKKLNVHETDL